ncbi:MAG TPA: prolyl oligopeptidase family serine peptidase, partial [Myxococcaceae bacterium]|nr:prolyl oligopeptidase family serine peptidase [Myxococcaceae bacterium]
MIDPVYPATLLQPSEYERGGQRIQDEFLWLEEAHAPEVRAWVEEQNAVAAEALRRLPRREQLRRELENAFSRPWTEPPQHHGQSSFWFHKPQGFGEPELWVRTSAESPARLLLKPEEMKSCSKSSISSPEISPDGRAIAYLERPNGSDLGTLFFIDVDSGERLSDAIPRSTRGLWDAEGRGMFYSHRSEGVNREVTWRYHHLGTAVSQDQVVYPGAASLWVTRNYLVWSHQRSDGQLPELWVGRRTGDAIRRKLEVSSSEMTAVSEWKGRLMLLVRRTSGEAEIVPIEADAPGAIGWRNVYWLGQTPDLVSFQMVEDFLVLEHRRDGQSRIRVCNLETATFKDVELPVVGVAGAVSTGGATELRYALTAPNYPTEYYNLCPRTAELRRTPGLQVNRLDLSGYQLDRVEYPSADGTRVPMTIFYRKGVRMDGETPTLIEAYGGFGISVLTGFSLSVLAWLDQGGVYAVAGLRGGGERGSAWHGAGYRAKKQNTIDDLVAAGRHLISAGITCAQRLALRGASNGGMVVAAAIMQQPELFGAAAIRVPILDIARFDSLVSPEAVPGCLSEYGNPEIPSELQTLIKYSPFHRVQDGQAYPPILMTCGDSDDRVSPAHSWKMAARLQTRASGGPFLVQTLANAGHGGTSSI